MREPSQLGLTKARERLGALVRRVAEGGEVVQIVRRGRPAATLISPERLAALDASAYDFGLLADVSHALITTLEVEQGLDRLVRSVAGWLGDACLVDGRVLRLCEDVARRAAVVVDNARLIAEQRTVAERFQRSLLTDPPELADLSVAARYAATAHAVDVGGDWYDVFRLPDGSVALVIGDVVGHDLDAAIRMSQLRNMLSSAAWLTPPDPATIVSELDRISAGLGLTALATLVVAVVRREEGGRWWHLRWANAGHLPPLVIDSEGDPTFLERSSEPLLGVVIDARRTTHEIELRPPATVLLYTDGLIERPPEPVDRSLRRLRRSVLQRPFDDPDKLCQGLLDDVGPDHGDDIALLAARLA